MNFKFQKHNVNLHHIESRPSKQDKTLYAFFVSCDNKTGGLKEAIQELKEKSTTLSILSRESDDKDASKSFFNLVLLVNSVLLQIKYISRKFHIYILCTNWAQMGWCLCETSYDP